MGKLNGIIDQVSVCVKFEVWWLGLAKNWLDKRVKNWHCLGKNLATTVENL